MIYLAFVTHDLQSNTIEAVMCEPTDTEIKRVSCINYSIEQKDQFIADLGADVAAPYIALAGW